MLGRKALIGISTHSLEEALDAEREGADYIGFGPVFRTSTKDTGPAQGIPALRTIAERVSIPVIAIGGITLETAEEVMGSGAAGLAVISAICASSEIAAAARLLLSAVQERSRSRSGGTSL
jgi:thiamine-phosphate pyrophosphorylase